MPPRNNLALFSFKLSVSEKENTNENKFDQCKKMTRLPEPM